MEAEVLNNDKLKFREGTLGEELLRNHLQNFKNTKKSGYKQINSYALDDTWKKISRLWGHSLHKMCSRTGSFPPSLARYFIWKFSKPGDKVLDPFSGKGTVPLEACLMGRVGIRNDVAPEAYVLTHSKVRPVPLPTIKKYLASLKKKISYEDLDVSDVGWKIKIFFHPHQLLHHFSFPIKSYFLKALDLALLSYGAGGRI